MTINELASAQIGDRELFLDCVRESGLICQEVASFEKPELSKSLGLPVTRELFRLSLPWNLQWHQREDVCAISLRMRNYHSTYQRKSRFIRICAAIYGTTGMPCICSERKNL